MKIQVINKSRHPLPKYQSEHAAGFDLTANIDQPITLNPLERKIVPTGIFIALPPGYEAQVRPRSGLAIKHGMTLVNAPGTIDADYRGEYCAAMINLSDQPYTIQDGERIAQVIIAKHETVEWEEVSELGQTTRGGGGFGHTGKQ